MSVRRIYRAPRKEEEEKIFWLEFQVCSDPFYDVVVDDNDNASSSTITNQNNNHNNKHFPLFPNLPFELRLKVWEHLLTPRIIIATCFDASEVAPKRAQLALRRRLPPVPVLLHICHETRQLALRHYELAFSWRVPPMHTTRPLSAPAKVWFDFRQDTLLLLGELEPYDASNMNAPMVYFLNRQDTRRVKHVACAFEELKLGEVESEQIFGCLFHVIDEFRGAERLVITSTDEDLARYQASLRGNGGAMNLGRGVGMLGGGALDHHHHHGFGFGVQRENVVQKIWWGWINGTSVVTSHLRDKQILMVREDGLADFIAQHS